MMRHRYTPPRRAANKANPVLSPPTLAGSHHMLKWYTFTMILLLIYLVLIDVMPLIQPGG